MSDLSRRNFLAITGTGVASIFTTASVADLLAAGRHAATAQQFEALNAADAADFEALTAQIVPSDGTPGAREARVVYFIDKAVATWGKAQRQEIDAGLKEVRARAAKLQPGATSFAALPDDKQIALIASLEKDKHQFFSFIRQATFAGMLSMPEYSGNYNKIGWRWIGFDDKFSWAAPFGWYDRNA